MIKANRNYKLYLASKNNGDLDILVTLPFTVEFDITRNTLTSANVCQIRVYNLNPDVRSLLRFNNSNYTQYRPVKLVAGYGDNMVEIFSGNITQAWSSREGTNFITQIECFDGGFAYVNAQAVVQPLPPFPPGTTVKQVVSTIAATSLPHVKLGVVGGYNDQLPSRRNTFTGPPMQVLSDLTGGGAFIDRGKFYALKTNEYIGNAGEVAVVSTASGLLNTPILEATTVRFDMLFEPALNVGTKVIINSSTEKGFNGNYKIVAVKHRGMISDAVCGSVVTSGDFFYSKILSPVG